MEQLELGSEYIEYPIHKTLSICHKLDITTCTNTYILVIKKERGEKEIETSNPTTHKSPSPSKNKYNKFLSSFLETVRLKRLKKMFLQHLCENF